MPFLDRAVSDQTSHTSSRQELLYCSIFKTSQDQYVAKFYVPSTSFTTVLGALLALLPGRAGRGLYAIPHLIRIRVLLSILVRRN